MNKVLVIGGSGVLGSAVVNELQKNKVDFLTGSRHQIKTDAYSKVNQSTDIPWQPVDLITGEGLQASLIGVDTVLHLASGQGKIGQGPFEVAITRNLLKAVRQSDVKHLIHISIVGIDKIPFSYYRAKLDTEALIRESQVPYTILRATQFHDFVEFGLRKLLSLPIGFVPKKLRLQPIHLDAVVKRLYELAEAGNQNTILNLGGPQVYELGTLAKIWMQYRRITKPIVSIPILGSLMNAIAQGNATCPEKAIGSKTWNDYLAEHYGS
ncbi:SDR family oxidoreductase [Spirosoma jeollabukense]